MMGNEEGNLRCRREKLETFLSDHPSSQQGRINPPELVKNMLAGRRLSPALKKDGRGLRKTWTRKFLT